MITASVITIGDELLIGQVSDTNSAWMATQLNNSGIKLRRRVAVGDDRAEIISALDQEKKLSDVILITGGLGPTSDDITKQVLCEYFNGTMIVHDETLHHIKHLFEVVLQKPMIQSNLLQAEIPNNCKVLLNSRGTAPGMWFEEAGKIFVSMPGVPHEMMGIMTDSVLPALENAFTLPFITHRTLLTIGVGESFLSEKIADFEASLPSNIKLAYLPNFAQVRLRLTATGNDKGDLDEAINSQFRTLCQLVKPHLVTDTDESMEAVVGKLLVKHKKTLSTAESCTGGYIAQLLTARAGSSEYYEGSIISYSYRAKENLLGVNAVNLKEHGAVSEAIVKEMARGALRILLTDYTIAVSGIMGPDGGMPDKPVGTVWIAVGYAKDIVTQKFTLRFNRQRNIQITAVNALNMLREFILKNEP